jgi:hypothetical protein
VEYVHPTILILLYHITTSPRTCCNRYTSVEASLRLIQKPRSRITGSQWLGWTSQSVTPALRRTSCFGAISAYPSDPFQPVLSKSSRYSDSLLEVWGNFPRKLGTIKTPFCHGTGVHISMYLGFRFQDSQGTLFCPRCSSHHLGTSSNYYTTKTITQLRHLKSFAVLH